MSIKIRYIGDEIGSVQQQELASNPGLYTGIAGDIYNMATIGTGSKIPYYLDATQSKVCYIEDVTASVQQQELASNPGLYTGIAGDIYNMATIGTGSALTTFILTQSRQQRTFDHPTKGIKFSTRFYSDASLAFNEIRFDSSDDISDETSKYWYDKVVDLSNNHKFTNSEDEGITVVTVQTISNDDFTDYLGAYTLQFSNWDFSANDPSDLSGVGTNGVNIFNKTAGIKWDISADMLVGIPTSYIQGSSDPSFVNFPVVITQSDNNMNALSHTDATNTSFIDLYAVFGKPILGKVLNAYDQSLNLISTDISFGISLI